MFFNKFLGLKQMQEAAAKWYIVIDVILGIMQYYHPAIKHLVAHSLLGEINLNWIRTRVLPHMGRESPCFFTNGCWLGWAIHWQIPCNSSNLLVLLNTDILIIGVSSFAKKVNTLIKDTWSVNKFRLGTETVHEYRRISLRSLYAAFVLVHVCF